MKLWNFALALYARPGVEHACLDAQQAGADVCLLLCGAWLDERGSPHQPAGRLRLQQVAETRQAHLIQPLRNVRQQLRQPALRSPQMAHLRERVKELELAAERQLLEQLQGLCVSWPTGARRTEPVWLEALAEPLGAGHPALALINAQRLALGAGAAAD